MEDNEIPHVILETHAPSSVPSVTLLQLVTMTFFCVSGGSFGLEDSVRGGYPLATIASLVLVPWLWSLPTALMTAELSTTFPSNGGYVLWTREAFGPFLGFLAGFWGFIYSMTDNALYPAMFIDYLTKLTGDLSPVGRYFVCALVIIFIAGMNLLGVGLVGRLSIFFLLMVLSPFIILSLWGLPQLSLTSLGATPPSGTADWALFLGVILWNTSGWNNIGSVAGSIVNPEKTYPKGLMISLILVIFTYLIPLSVGVSINKDFPSWTVGSYSDVAYLLGGKHFRNYMSFIGMISALGIFNVRLCTSSNALAAMGDEIGWPTLGTLLSRFKTPWVSILFLSCGIGIFVLLPFDILVQIDMAIYSLSLSMQFLALYWLRKREPHLKRPYRLPFGERGVLMFIAVPVLFCLLSLSYTIVFARQLISQIVLLICIFLGIPLYYFVEWLKKKRVYQHPTMIELDQESPFLIEDEPPQQKQQTEQL